MVEKNLSKGTMATQVAESGVVPLTEGEVGKSGMDACLDSLMKLSIDTFVGDYSLPKIVKEGWLYKRGKHIKNWYPRYFLLFNDGALNGYKKRSEMSLLKGPSNKYIVRDCQVLKIDGLCRENMFLLRCFKQTSMVKRTFHTKMPEEREEWCAAVTEVSENLDAQEDNRIINKTNDRLSKADSVRILSRGCEDFELVKLLGMGSYGKVFLGREKKTSLLCAIKMINKKNMIAKDEVEHTLTENRILRHTQHPFLVSLRCSFQTKKHLCIVMEYINGGELFFHFNKAFGEMRTRFYASQIILALKYLHSRGVIYRDLKLENILLDTEGYIKLADFGLCKEEIIHGKTTKTFCGTAEYMAPEILESCNYGVAVDWWSLGVVMYEMILGRIPFDNHNQNVLFEEIKRKKIYLPPTLSSESSDLLRKLLDKNPRKRIGSGLDDAQEIMDHAFFKIIDWQLIYEKKVEAPYKPQVENETDTSNFSQEFTDKSVKPTLLDFDLDTNIEEQPHFKQFSYPPKI